MLKAAWIFAYGFASAVLLADFSSGDHDQSTTHQLAAVAYAGEDHGQR